MQRNMQTLCRRTPLRLVWLSPSRAYMTIPACINNLISFYCLVSLSQPTSGSEIDAGCRQM